MKTFKKFRDNIQCPVCLKKFKTKQAFGSHFRPKNKAHAMFMRKYKEMVIRLYLKGWTRQELKFNEHMLFSNKIQNLTISEYLHEHPEDRQIKPSRIIEFACDNCGKLKKSCQAKYNLYKNHFCGKKCSDEFREKYPRPSWNTGLDLEDPRVKAMGKKHKKWLKEHKKEHSESIKNSGKIGKEDNPEWYKNVCKANREIVAPQHIGMKHSKETKKKMSISMTGKKHGSPSPESQKKRVASINAKPNNLEKQFAEFLEKYNLPYKYNGKDRGVMVHYRIPDFVHINIEKERKIIEIFGTIFHKADKSWFDLPANRTYAATKQYYKSRNYNCLIIWDKEFKKDNWEEKILNKINKFEEKTSQKIKLTSNNTGANLLQIQLANSRI